MLKGERLLTTWDKWCYREGAPAPDIIAAKPEAGGLVEEKRRHEFCR
jgi:hypothetical protein